MSYLQDFLNSLPFWPFILLVLVFFSVKIVNESQRVVVFRLGRFNRVAGPGIVFIIPALEWIRVVDLRTLTTPVAQQETITRDNVPAKINAVIRRLGQEIDHPDSICYWAARNGIPIYCPALTDGSLGDMLYFHSYRTPGLVIDLVGDIRAVNDEALHVRQPAKTGIIILGGGVAKHHVANANLMRNGADFAVYVNTAHEFDGSDSGARPDEAVSWGKIRTDARPVKLSADATLVFPLLVAQTFAKHWQPVTPAV